MERKLFITYILIAGIFIFGAIFVLSHLLILQGAVKERADKECVSPVTMHNWEQLLEITKVAGEEAQINVQEFKNQCELRIKKAEEERDKYHGWYKYEKNK